MPGTFRYKNIEFNGNLKENAPTSTKITTYYLRLPLSLKAAVEKFAAAGEPA
jgi:hypothetical protein